MRGQTSLEYLLLTAGIVVVAVTAGYYVTTGISNVSSQMQAIDFVKPVIDIISPPSGATLTSTTVTVEFNVSDDRALTSIAIDCNSDGTPEMEISNPSNPYSGTYVCTYSSPGSYTIKIIAKDSSGNTGVAARYFTITLSNNPPSITITSPSNGQTLIALSFPYSVTIEWSASDPDGDSLVFSVDCQNDGTPDDTTTSTSYSCTYPSEGTYTAKVIASDGRGGTAYDTTTFTIQYLPPGQIPPSPDTIPPTVDINITPTSGDTSTAFTISCFASDPSGISWTKIYVDNTLKKTCYSSTCSYSSTFPAGTHTAECVASDTYKNVASASGTFVVTATPSDNPPTITSFSANPSSITVGSSTTLTCEATDDKGISSIEIYKNTTDATPAKTCTSSPCSVSVTYTTTGTHTAKCVAIDTAIQEATATTTITITSSNASDNTPPSVDLSASPTVITLGQYVTLTCDAQDTGTGLASITMLIGSTPLRTCTFSGQTTGVCTTTHTPATTGTKTYTCVAKDQNGNTASDSVLVNVVNGGGGGSAEICDNGKDDDNDGKVDCADPDCAGLQGPDGDICCQSDADCPDSTAQVQGSSCIKELYVCDQGLHICLHMTGTTNCDDYDVCNPPTQWVDYEPTISSCTPSCSGVDCCEKFFELISGCTVYSIGVGTQTVSECGSTGSVDCGSYYCYYDGGYKMGTLPSAETDCSDGHDNDCDGKTDCADPDCAADPACCSDECSTPGATTTRCNGAALEQGTCGNYDADPCLEWGNWAVIEQCSTQCVECCTDADCPSDGWYETTNGYEYRDYSCTSNHTCTYTVTQSCTDECTPLGACTCGLEDPCEGTGYPYLQEICVTDADNDPCTEWEMECVASCPPGSPG